MCDDCVLLLFAGDWAGLEDLVYAYQEPEHWWDRRKARKVARRIANANKTLFRYLQETNHG